MNGRSLFIFLSADARGSSGGRYGVDIVAGWIERERERAHRHRHTADCNLFHSTLDMHPVSQSTGFVHAEKKKDTPSHYSL